jgi:hypothetical protein
MTNGKIYYDLLSVPYDASTEEIHIACSWSACLGSPRSTMRETQSGGRDAMAFDALH